MLRKYRLIRNDFQLIWVEQSREQKKKRVSLCQMLGQLLVHEAHERVLDVRGKQWPPGQRLMIGRPSPGALAEAEVVLERLG